MTKMTNNTFIEHFAGFVNKSLSIIRSDRFFISVSDRALNIFYLQFSCAVNINIVNSKQINDKNENLV